MTRSKHFDNNMWFEKPWWSLLLPSQTNQTGSYWVCIKNHFFFLLKLFFFGKMVFPMVDTCMHVNHFESYILVLRTNEKPTHNEFPLCWLSTSFWKKNWFFWLLKISCLSAKSKQRTTAADVEMANLKWLIISLIFIMTTNSARIIFPGNHFF